jgi:protein SCO1/2
MNKKIVIKFFAFLIATILPVIVFLYFKEKNNFANSIAPKPMWPIGVSSSGDTLYKQVPVFKAINADGNEISTEQMEGSISLVELFFTECTSICPVMNKQMDRIYKSLARNDHFKIYSYSIDPERDSLEALKAYSRKFDADLTRWYFLRANQDSVFNFGRKGLNIAVGTEDKVGDFLHSERFVLVDSKRNIRGYYDGTDSSSVNQLMNHIVILLEQMDHKKKK